MKILFINNEFPPIGGGGSIVASYLAKNLTNLGHKIVVITSSFNGLAREEKIDGYKIIRTPALRKSKDYSGYLELISFFISSFFFGLKFIPKFKPDFIQAFFSVPSGASAFLLSKIFKIPYAVFLGGSDVPGANPIRHKKIYPFVTPIIKPVLKNAGFVSACSDALVDKVKQHLPELKIKKIPNGVDTDYFKPPKSKPKIPPVIILGVGRLMVRKGFQYFIKAAAKIKKERKFRFKIILLGSGEYGEKLKKISFKFSLDDKIEFVDTVPYKELRRYYQKAHIFCLPSLAEGMPLAMIEAMSCGCALLTTNVAGNQELVKQGVNGYLVEAGNADELKKGLLRLLKKPKEILTMGKESRKLAKKYDWKVITKNYLKNYRHLI